MVKLSEARVIRHGHPHWYPFGYSCKWSEVVDIHTDILVLWPFTWISTRISVRMSSNHPCYGQFDQVCWVGKAESIRNCFWLWYTWIAFWFMLPLHFCANLWQFFAHHFGYGFAVWQILTTSYRLLVASVMYICLCLFFMISVISKMPDEGVEHWSLEVVSYVR